MSGHTIFKSILAILGIICFLINFFFLIFYHNYYSSEAIKILFYISLSLIYFIYIFILFMELPIKNKTINKFRKKCISSCGRCAIFILFLIFILFEIIILSYMIDYNSEYWKNCPFTITDNYNLHYKRRSELYNINKIVDFQINIFALIILLIVLNIHINQAVNIHIK